MNRPETQSTFQTPQQNSSSWASHTWIKTLVTRRSECCRITHFLTISSQLSGMFDRSNCTVTSKPGGQQRLWYCFTNSYPVIVANEFIIIGDDLTHHRPQRLASPHIPSWGRRLPHAPAAPCRTSGWCSHLLWSCLLWDWISWRDNHESKPNSTNRLNFVCFKIYL